MSKQDDDDFKRWRKEGKERDKKMREGKRMPHGPTQGRSGELIRKKFLGEHGDEN